MGVEPEYKMKGEVGLEVLAQIKEALWWQAFQYYCHFEAYAVVWEERNRALVKSGSKTSRQDTPMTIDIIGLY